MKIVLIGAGSRSFARGQIVDLMSSKDFKGRGVTLSLVDIIEEPLKLMKGFAEKVNEHYGAGFKVESHTDRTKALPGADYVITSVCVQRYPLWEQDFRVPLSYGFKHVLGENGGPGAIFHALRSFKLIMPICQDIEKLCPKATLLNFTNPEARVLHAILSLTKVKALGICHGFGSTHKYIPEALDRPMSELHIVSAGMNHFYQVLEVKDKKTGADLLPEALQKIKAQEPTAHTGLFQKMAEIFDMLTYRSDDHIGEYLSYGSEFAGIKWPYGQEVKAVGAKGKGGKVPLEAYVYENRTLDDNILKGSGEITVPIIEDLELGRKSWQSAVNVMNTEGYIPNLPANAVVEVPAVVENGKISPQKVGPIFEPLAAFMRTQFTIHNLLTEAYRTRDKRLLLQALLVDPVVNSITNAEKMLDEMLELQKEYLPSFDGAAETDAVQEKRA